MRELHLGRAEGSACHRDGDGDVLPFDWGRPSDEFGKPTLSYIELVVPSPSQGLGAEGEQGSGRMYGAQDGCKSEIDRWGHVALMTIRQGKRRDSRSFVCMTANQTDRSSLCWRFHGKQSIITVVTQKRHLHASSGLNTRR